MKRWLKTFANEELEELVDSSAEEAEEDEEDEEIVEEESVTGALETFREYHPQMERSISSSHKFVFRFSLLLFEIIHRINF